MGIFKFKGGQREERVRGTIATYKFYCFAVMEDNSEIIFFDALKRGLIEKLDHSGRYNAMTDTLKVFSASKGFGVPTAYQSFFFKLDDLSDRLATIVPFGSEVGMFKKTPHAEHSAGESAGYHFFQARGRFMSFDEIVRKFGRTSQTVNFYNRQTILPKNELKKLVAIDYVTEAGSPVQVRSLRV